MVHFTLEVAEQSIQQKAIVYDRAGDAHYDTISAFIKSMRSYEKGAIYWLAKMLHAGEDFRFIARRIVIFASEDVGLADRKRCRSRSPRSRRSSSSVCRKRVFPSPTRSVTWSRRKIVKPTKRSAPPRKKSNPEQTERVPEQLKNKHFPVNPKGS